MYNSIKQLKDAVQSSDCCYPGVGLFALSSCHLTCAADAVGSQLDPQNAVSFQACTLSSSDLRLILRDTLRVESPFLLMVVLHNRVA